MHITERRIYAGHTLEIQRYLEEKARITERSEPKPRFKCAEDRQVFMLGRSRRKFERLVNANFTPAGYYCTFTFDEENECHTAAETNYLRGLYIRRIKRKYPEAKIVSVIGTGKKTSRYHVHMLAEGVPKEYLEKQWTYGDVKRIEPLREHNYYEGVDHGRDYTALADYMFEHWTPEQGKHKWKATRNLSQPEIEITTEPAGSAAKKGIVDVEIPEPPAGYIFIEAKQTEYGFSSFKYVVDPKPKKKKRMAEQRNKKKRKQTGMKQRN